MNVLILGLTLAGLAAQEPANQPAGDLLGTESLPGAGIQAWVEHAGAVHQLRLQPIATRTAKTFRVETPSGTRYVDRQVGNHFRGTVEGDPGAEVAAFYAGDKLHALVLRGDGSGWTLAPDRDVPGSYESMTLEEAEWLTAPFECGVPEIAPGSGNGPAETQGQAADGGTTSALTGDPLLVQVALDSDYEFYLWHGGTEAETAAFMEGTLLTCSLLFERDLNMRFEATEIVVRPDPNAPGYPYTTTGPCLSACMTPWWSAYVGEPFQTVHQFSGKSHPNQNGSAGIDALCVSEPIWRMNGYHDLDAGNTYANRVWTMSHELGHNCGSQHTIQGIMKSPAGFNGSPLTPKFRFDPISIGQIQTFVASLDSDCLPGTVSGSATPAVSSVLPGSVTPFAAGQVTVLGTHMQNTVEVDLNGRLINYDGIELVSETEIRIATLPGDWTSLGTQNLTVHGPNAGSAGTFQLVAPATPEMEVSVYAIFGPDPQVAVTSSYEAGWISVVLWSYTDATFPQGSLQILQNASVVEVGSTAATGLNSVWWTPLNEGIPTGSTIYMQTVLVDPVTATRAASPVVEVLVDIL